MEVQQRIKLEKNMKEVPFDKQVTSVFGTLKSKPTLPPQKISGANAFVRKHFEKKRATSKKNDK